MFLIIPHNFKVIFLLLKVICQLVNFPSFLPKNAALPLPQFLTAKYRRTGLEYHQESGGSVRCFEVEPRPVFPGCWDHAPIPAIGRPRPRAADFLEENDEHKLHRMNLIKLFIIVRFLHSNLNLIEIQDEFLKFEENCTFRKIEAEEEKAQSNQFLALQHTHTASSPLVP